MVTAKKSKGMAQLNAEVPVGLKKSLKLLATERSITLGKLVTQIIEDYIQEETKKDRAAANSNSASQGVV